MEYGREYRDADNGSDKQHQANERSFSLGRLVRFAHTATHLNYVFLCHRLS